MNAEDFVARVIRHVALPAVNNVVDNIADPPERTPPASIVALSRWYSSLSAEDKGRVHDIVKVSIFTALFDFFSVLDQVAFIEKGPNPGEFQLFYCKGGDRKLLNSPPNDLLHDLLKADWDDQSQQANLS